jgi:uncharacterized protein (TIGR03435 family)
LPPPAGSSIKSCNVKITGNRYEGEGTIEDLLAILRGFVGRVVINKTGLSGSYRFVFEAVPEALDAGQPSSLTSGTPAFAAVREQLGLRLLPSTGPARFWVIDRLDPPTEN